MANDLARENEQFRFARHPTHAVSCARSIHRSIATTIRATICETCEHPFSDGAVKIFKGKKVCPSCFQALTTSSVPESNQSLQIIQTQHIQTTVCPECNAEVHIHTKTCPKCGAMVRTIDRAVGAFWRKAYWLIGAFGVLVFVTAIPFGIDTGQTVGAVSCAIFGGICVALGIWGYRRHRPKPPHSSS